MHSRLIRRRKPVDIASSASRSSRPVSVTSASVMINTWQRVLTLRNR